MMITVFFFLILRQRPKHLKLFKPFFFSRCCRRNASSEQLFFVTEVFAQTGKFPWEAEKSWHQRIASGNTHGHSPTYSNTLRWLNTSHPPAPFPPAPVVLVAILLYRESPLEILEKMLILLAAGLSISPCSAGDWLRGRTGPLCPPITFLSKHYAPLFKTIP